MADTRLTEVKSLLETPLDTDNPHNLMKQLAYIEAAVAYVAILKRNASQKLSEARQEHLPAKSKEYTELDRKTHLEALTANEEKSVGILEDLERNLYTKISLGQTMVKSMTEELKRQIN